jgi:hypothetical protein
MPVINCTLECKAMLKETIYLTIRADPRGVLALCNMEINPDLFDDPWDQKEVIRKIRGWYDGFETCPAQKMRQ